VVCRVWLGWLSMNTYWLSMDRLGGLDRIISWLGIGWEGWIGLLVGLG
jgi:hypothetical protein